MFLNELHLLLFYHCTQEETRSREALLKKIATLKERKEKLEGLMDSFAQVQLEDPEATPEGSSEESDSGDGEGDTSVEQAEEASGTSEFVNPSEGLADAELEAKLRYLLCVTIMLGVVTECILQESC